MAPNASLSDAIPTGTTFASNAGRPGTCQLDQVEDVPAASCDLGRLAVDATATATLVVDTDASLTSVANAVLADGATVSTASVDTVAVNDVDRDIILVVAAGTAA